MDVEHPHQDHSTDQKAVPNQADRLSGSIPVPSFRETDLYAPVRDYLQAQGFAVRSEVAHCDLVAIKGDDTVVVELKGQLNLAVILQAVQRQRLADTVWIAIPAAKGRRSLKHWRQVLHLLRRLEIGLLEVDLNDPVHYVAILLEGLPFDRARSRSQAAKARKHLLHEFSGRHGDLNTGGQSKRKIITVYREQALYAAALLEKSGEPLTAAQLRKLGADERIYNKLYHNHYGWFEPAGQGRYKLTATGAQALSTWHDLVGHLFKDAQP